MLISPEARHKKSAELDFGFLSGSLGSQSLYCQINQYRDEDLRMENTWLSVIFRVS